MLLITYSVCKLSMMALDINVPSKVRTSGLRGCSSIPVPEDYAPVPHPCVCWSSLGLYEVKGLAQWSLFSKMLYIFYWIRPKGVNSPLLGIRNHLMSELVLGLEVSLWRLWISVKTTWAKQFCHYNQKTLLSKTKRPLLKIFQVDHVIYVRMPNHS